MVQQSATGMARNTQPYLRVIQANANRIREAMDLLYQGIQEDKTDIVVVSEPNKKVVNGGKWETDRDNDVAINICSEGAKIYNKGNGKGFIWLDIG